jgi:hypothetical protein
MLSEINVVLCYVLSEYHIFCSSAGLEMAKNSMNTKVSENVKTKMFLTNIRKNFAVFCLSRTFSSTLLRDENFCKHAPCTFWQDLMGFAKKKYSNLKALTKMFTFLRKENVFVFKHLRFRLSALLLLVDAGNIITLFKKKIKYSSYVRKFRRDRLQSLTKGLLIYGSISARFLRKPFLIYDFATDLI